MERRGLRDSLSGKRNLSAADDLAADKFFEELLNETITESLMQGDYEKVNHPALGKKGHKKGHGGALLLLLFVALIGCQMGVLYWKQNYYRSYHTFTLWGLWIIPFCLALMMGNYRFIAIWFAFSLMASYVIRKAIQRPLSHETPRFVYKFFAIIYRVTYSIGLVGYVIMMIEFLGFGPIDKVGLSIFEFGLYLLFYGLYFGVLSRDIIQECSDRMASTVGYYNPGGIPVKHLRENICAICGSELAGHLSRFSDDKPTTQTDPDESIIALDCRHQFHEFCIRGWCIIGKKDMCPYCKEKVDLKLLKKNNPWDTQEAFYLSFLDGLRYFLVFQPLVLFAVQGFAHITGMDKP